jgi:very-short-patch-repair endonuclease
LITIETQKKFDWCKNIKTNKFLSFDFYIPELRLIIELDGLQHFKQVSSWTSPEITRGRDIFKIKKCIEHGLTVIRLLQDDVWYDKNNWEESLQRELIVRKLPLIVYLSQNHEYEVYIDEMQT